MEKWKRLEAERDKTLEEDFFFSLLIDREREENSGNGQSDVTKANTSRSQAGDTNSEAGLGLRTQRHVVYARRRCPQAPVSCCHVEMQCCQIL